MKPMYFLEYFWRFSRKWHHFCFFVVTHLNISLKLVPRGPTNNIPTLVQVMAWCRPGDKPLSEPMMVSLPTYIYVTRPQWVKMWLTHWGWVHICVSKLTIIGSDNGLSPGWRPAIIWANGGILLTGPLGTNFIEILIAIETFSFEKMHLKILSGKCRPFCLDLNVLKKGQEIPL